MTVRSWTGGMSPSLSVTGKNEPAGAAVSAAGATAGGAGEAAFVAGAGAGTAGFAGLAPPRVPAPVIAALRAAAATTGAGTCGIDTGDASAPLASVSAAGVAGASGSPATPASNADFPLPFACTNRSMVARDASSSLMNLTPMPAGMLPVAMAPSRFHTTRPTPPMTATSPAMRISNLSSVPGANGVAVLMKTPPLLTSYEWFSMNSSTVALL